MTRYAELPGLLARCTSAKGTFISLGEAFISRGIQEIDNYILPTLRQQIRGAILRVLPSYGSGLRSRCAVQYSYGGQCMFLMRNPQELRREKASGDTVGRIVSAIDISPSVG